MHSKAPKVIVAGLEQRFCQQCSRFHQLPEFDQGKRSCRRRLAGHSERRRKPPPGPFASRFARHSSFQEEPGRLRRFLVDFSYPRISSATRDVWPTIQPVAPGATNRYLAVLYPPCNAAVVHGVHPCIHALSEWPVHSLPERSPASDCLAGVSDSSCALSLLSTQPWNSNARNRVSTTMSANINGTLMAHPTITNNSIPNSWSCISRRGKTSSQNIQRDTGLAGAAEVGDHQLSGELELALQGNGQCTDRACSSRAAGYHESEHAIHWSL